ncbi:MAG: ABC transporter permease subunit, partial [Acidimicrobiales bacterium]
MTTFLSFTIVGVVVGCGYAVASLGLVVTYTTSGIFNFAHGAIGMLMAFAYWELHVHQGWPAPIALVAVLFVLAPLTGAVIERLLMRPLHGSSTGTSLVVTLGLMLALIGIATSVWDPGTARVIPEFFAGHHLRIFQVNVTFHQLTVIALAGLVAIGLRAFFYRTRTGVAMRAVVDDPELAALNGAAPARVAQLSWALGASLAALAGILLAPLVYLDIITLTLLVVNAYAAAIVGRMRNLPRTFLGALILGLTESYFVGYLVQSKLSFNLLVGHLRVGRVLDDLNVTKLALPIVFFFIVLVTMPQVRLRAGRLVGGRSPRVPGLKESLMAGAAFVVLAFVISPLLSFNTLSHAGQGLALGLIMLSLVLLTGYGGQVSLCQLTFVGLGAFAMGKFAGGGSPMGLLVAAAFAAPWGFLVSLPALPLTGLYLALATLAFARGMETLFFNNPHVFGFGGRLRVGRISLL